MPKYLDSLFYYSLSVRLFDKDSDIVMKHTTEKGVFYTRFRSGRHTIIFPGDALISGPSDRKFTKELCVQRGDGTFIIKEVIYPKGYKLPLPDGMPARWNTETVNWGSTIRLSRNESGDVVPFRAYITIPDFSPHISLIRGVLRMPVRYPEFDQGAYYRNVEEVRSTEPIYLLLIPIKYTDRIDSFQLAFPKSSYDGA
jgi:hypothetical protein